MRSDTSLEARTESKLGTNDNGQGFVLENILEGLLAGDWEQSHFAFAIGVEPEHTREF